MIIIKNKFIPFKGFTCMNILGLLFVREDAHLSSRTFHHEAIHTAQQYEIIMLSALMSLLLCNIFQSWWYILIAVLLPLALYLLGFIIELAIPPYHNLKSTKGVISKIRKAWMDAYEDNCFEREAYMNQHTDDYLVTRTLFAWVKYILKKNERN